MKIGFDAKRITQNATGLGNYGRFVVDALAEQYPEDDFLLYSPEKVREHLKDLIPAQENIFYNYPKKSYRILSKGIWRSYGIIEDLKRSEVDLFHGLSNELPLGIKKIEIPAVVTVHDLIFLRYPQFYKKIDREIYKFKYQKACNRADQIIAVSETTKKDIINLFRIPDKKISVVYQGCNSLFLQQYSDEKKKSIQLKFGLPNQYILSVGTIEHRKNLLLVVKALKESKLDIKLVVVGKQTSYAHLVKEYILNNKMQDQVLFLNNVSFTELPLIYQMASLFVYPSLFEGFGIPILEALHSCVPVIAATGSCLEEAGGPGSLYVDPANEHELAEKMKWVFTSPEKANQMRIAGKKYASRFLAPQIAQDLMTIYRKFV